MLGNEPNWFNVFDTGTNLWLQDDEISWGPYSGAVELSDSESAHRIAKRAMKLKGSDYDGVITVFADYGSVD